MYFWKRYIDDIFMIWIHSRSELDEFISYLNSCHQTIKFTAEISETEIPFLDTLVHLDTDGTIWTDLYINRQTVICT